MYLLAYLLLPFIQVCGIGGGASTPATPLA